MEYAYTTGELGEPTDAVVYTYGDPEWGDLLTAYDGQTITHDAIGNPLTDGTWTYTWEHGRELASMTDGETTWDYTYNADGLRTKRTNGTITYNYLYLNGQLVKETIGDTAMYFAYDADGKPMSVLYNDVTYYYVTNLQGDVVAILSNTGELVVSYSYDAWGNPLSTSGTMADTLGTHNPLRYRGYIYDAETGLYYLKSRYYDPQMGRFINADVFASTGQGVLGSNAFAYCSNSPISNIDYDGTRHALTNQDMLAGSIVEDSIEAARYAGTISLGGAGSVNVGPWVWGAQACITIDSNGFAALQVGFSEGISAGSASNSIHIIPTFSPYFMITNALGYSGLEGPSVQIGGAFPPYVIDYVGALDKTGTEILYHGLCVGGFPTTSDMHITGGYTWTFASTPFDWDMYYRITQY